MRPVAIVACSGLAAGCADLLGFQPFTRQGADGGPSVDASSPPFSSDGGSSPGRDGSGCDPSCGPGQKCQNDSCVCDPTTCAGCCSGAACSTSWPGCGAGGGACTACDARSDRCDGSGACACGAGAVCAPGQRCAAGGCTCDATSCAGTCCGDTCVDVGTDAANCGACGHSCLGAGCKGGLCAPATLATAGLTAWGMTIGPGAVFWLSSSGAYSCPLAGCGAAPSGPFAAPTYGFSNGDLVAYWDSGAGSRVFASGGTSTGDDLLDMKPDGTSVSFFAATPASGWHLSTDGVYWFGGGTLSKTGIVSHLQQTIMTNLVTVASVADDANNVYVADGIQVLACPKATVQCGSKPVLVANIGSADLLATEPDSSYVYFSFGKGIYRCPESGCTPPQTVPIWVGGQGHVQSMVTDANAMYWTDSGNGTVMKCALGATCANPVTLASDPAFTPWGIAVDSSWVYWTLANGAVAVKRVAK